MKRLFYLFVLVSLETAAFASNSDCPGGLKPIALSSLYWTEAYDGYGKITFSGGILHLEPRRARSPQSTHASLVLSKAILPSEKFDILIEYKNSEALRRESPNPWELLWVFFQYQPAGGLEKTTNYVIAKTNGLEIGKAFGEIGQTFLKTDESSRAGFEKWHTLRIQRDGGNLRVQLDAHPPLLWKDSDSTRLYNQQGGIGLYTEDARVSVRKVCVAGS